MISAELYKFYYDDLQAEQLVNSKEYIDIEDAFLKTRCEFLLDQEVIKDIHFVKYSKPDLNIRVDAWGTKTFDESLVLIITDFRDTESLINQNLSTFRAYINKAKRFFASALKEDFRLRELRYGTSVAGLADYIFSNRKSIDDITIIGLTNTRITSRDNTLVITENTTTEYTFHYDVWDIERLLRIDSSSKGRESVDIDFVNDYGMSSGVEALKASVDCKDVSSYLFVLPGNVLAKMYETWNERLLEQNPRTFLQFSGKVNKGILGTVLTKPDMFFCYNNGISAVAEDVEYDILTRKIYSIKNLQIVNGGQTTATIYNSIKTAKARRVDLHLENVSVMVKLSVLNDVEKAIEIIPKISEYSNTQNKVATASFSNHHPYHKEMEKYSRNTWTPSMVGIKETHWYYERVLGQYKNAINLCRTKAEKESFKSVNPQKQMLKPVDWAKIIMTFDSKPYVVCLGAQKCYAQFCKDYLKTNDDGSGIIDGSVNEQLFKDTCAKAILFKSLEQRISNNIRFVSVPYVLATINEKLKGENLVFDYEKIWKTQWDNEALFEAIRSIGDAVINKIIGTMPDSYSLPSEWGKKVDCWEKVKHVQIDITPLKYYCIPLNNYMDLRQSSRQEKLMDMGIDVQTQVIKRGDKYWRSLYSWCQNYMKITDKEESILLYATNFKRVIPTEAQCKVIIAIEKRAVTEGFQ